MKLLEYIKNVKFIGVKITIKQILLAAINKVFFFRTYQIMILEISRLDPRYLSVPSHFWSGFLNLQDLKTFSSNKDYALPSSFLEEAFRKGDYCFCIVENEILASYGWYATTSSDITDDLVFNFNNEWVYMYKGYTHPDYRGQRLHAIGMANALKYFTDNGAKGIISWVQTTNIKSLRSTERLGYEKIGIVRVYKIFGRYKSKHSPSCAQYGVSIEPKIHIQ